MALGKALKIRLFNTIGAFWRLFKITKKLQFWRWLSGKIVKNRIFNKMRFLTILPIPHRQILGHKKGHFLAFFVRLSGLGLPDPPEYRFTKKWIFPWEKNLKAGHYPLGPNRQKSIWAERVVVGFEIFSRPKIVIFPDFLKKIGFLTLDFFKNLTIFIKTLKIYRVDLMII